MQYYELIPMYQNLFCTFNVLLEYSIVPFVRSAQTISPMPWLFRTKTSITYEFIIYECIQLEPEPALPKVCYYIIYPL